MNQRSKIAILGFGVEGRAVFEYLNKHKYPNLTVCDQNVDLKDEMPDGISVRLGEEYLHNLDDFEVIFRSPGIRYLDPQVQTAVNKGVEITSCTGFFIDQCPCKIIGVTGTKGKGTTCTLIFNILEKAGFDAYLGGNIGMPPVQFLDDLTKDSVVVLELSSFQLHDLKKSPHISVFLNTTSDHLDYHADTDEYTQAKESIITHQNKDCTAIFNRDYDYTNQYLPLVKGKLRLVSVKNEVKDGCFVKNEKIFYAKDGENKELMDIKDIKLIGSHNLENVMPAVAVCKELKIKDEPIVEVISNFEGLPHRLEFVKEVNKIKYYNDSFSTTPETSMAAVDSFDVPMVLIAGGFDKTLNYEDWALKILTKENLYSVVLIGDIAERMENDLRDAEKKLGEAEGSPTKIIRKSDFHDAVKVASKEAKSGGVVVLSPGSSSFDWFPNYKVRGEAFRKEVRKLKM